MGRRATTAALGLTLAGTGCLAPPRPQAIDHPDPASAIPAIARAAEQSAPEDIALLVERLEDEDPAIRLYAITALQRLTGQTHGYLYYADEASRAAAVQRWRDATPQESRP